MLADILNSTGLERFSDGESSCEEAEDFLEKRLIEAQLEKGLRGSSIKSGVSEPSSPIEFLLPLGLLQTVADDIWTNCNDEPCGARGCLLYIHLEEKETKVLTKSKLLAKVPFDRYTVPTFEIHITFKPEGSSWTSKLPQFLRGLSNNNNHAIVLRQQYDLKKKRLFRNQ